MRGFDSKGQDVRGFIIGFAKEIWDNQEHTLIDETAIWEQILQQTGQHE